MPTEAAVLPELGFDDAQAWQAWLAQGETIHPQSTKA
jgi:hypothetical protein